MHMKSHPWLVALPLLLPVIAGCGQGPNANARYAPVVTVADPIRKEFVEWDRYTGRLDAIEFVDARAARDR